VTHLLTDTENGAIFWWTLLLLPNLLEDTKCIKIFILGLGGDRRAVKCHFAPFFFLLSPFLFFLAGGSSGDEGERRRWMGERGAQAPVTQEEASA
jgi:hypothetical protein